jgi:pilus assembly protein Flp/PilA
MRLSLPELLRDDRGATAIEYGLIGALIAVIAIVGMTTFGSNLAGLFNYTANRATSVWDNASNG